MKELIDTSDFVWRNPSDDIKELCQDIGCIQQGHHNLEDMIEDHNMWVFKECCESKCPNCEHYGFPCGNLAVHGFQNMDISEIWKPNWV